ncbi:hypothetical protein ACFL14_01505 [Patescibacteria group bacterium]
MKKSSVVILLFVFMGFLIQLIVHAVVEISYIYLLNTDFETYSFGLTWKNWYTIHHLFTIIIVIMGLYIGYKYGKKYSKKIK